jgi:hypothetical protein
MLGPAIRERLTNTEFQPFALVLANGERIVVRHPDSVTLSSVEVRGKRVFASTMIVLETQGDSVIERVSSLPLVAQVVREQGLNASR